MDLESLREELHRLRIAERETWDKMDKLEMHRIQVRVDEWDPLWKRIYEVERLIRKAEKNQPKE